MFEWLYLLYLLKKKCDYVFFFQLNFRGDCGVFMLKCIEFLISGKKIGFDQNDINFFRQKYCIDLYNRQL